MGPKRPNASYWHNRYNEDPNGTENSRVSKSRTPVRYSRISGTIGILILDTTGPRAPRRTKDSKPRNMFCKTPDRPPLVVLLVVAFLGALLG